MRTEAQANDALHAAAQRIEWEGAHMDAWCAPAPHRMGHRNGKHATDYVLAALLACVILALTVGVL